MIKFLFIFIFAFFMILLALGVYLLKRVRNAIFKMFNNNISVSKNQKIDEENEILYKSGDTIIMKGEAKSSD